MEVRTPKERYMKLLETIMGYVALAIGLFLFAYWLALMAYCAFPHVFIKG
jgi:hypothetical protein